MTYETFVAINNIAKERMPEKCFELRIKSQLVDGDDFDMGYVCEYRGKDLFITIPQMLDMVYQCGAHVSNPSAIKNNKGWSKETRKNLILTTPQSNDIKYHGCHPYNAVMAGYKFLDTCFNLVVDGQFFMRLPEKDIMKLVGLSEKEKAKGVKDLIKDINKLLVKQKRTAFSEEEQKVIYDTLTEWLKGR